MQLTAHNVLANLPCHKDNAFTVGVDPSLPTLPGYHPYQARLPVGVDPWGVALNYLMSAACLSNPIPKPNTNPSPNPNPNS